MKQDILHVEDYDIKKGIDYSKILRMESERNDFSYDWIDNLKDAKEKIDNKEFDFFVLDGQFPSEKTLKPDKNSFFEIYNFLLHKRIEKNRMIVWSNSTTIHNFCYDNNLTCFSKKEMKEEDYTKKGNDPSKNVDKKEAKEIIYEIIKKLKK